MIALGADTVLWVVLSCMRWQQRARRAWPIYEPDRERDESGNDADWREIDCEITQDSLVQGLGKELPAALLR